MEAVLALARELHIPYDMIQALAALAIPEDEADVQALTDPARFAVATERILKYEDPRGVRSLHTMLSAALCTRCHYRERGITDAVFLATMGCFARFIGEHWVSYGTYAFDRAFWTGRQTAMTLFRLGTLEYEMVTEQGERMISVHIPSDADLTPATIDASLATAHAFFAQHAPDYVGVPYICHSWLLSPALAELLAPSSRLVQFQRRFEIKQVYPDAESYRRWVFKDPRLASCDFPETTSLQRTMKAYILAGGKVGEAYGVMRKNNE